MTRRYDIKLSDEAEADLADIREQIAKDSASRADAMIGRIILQVERLSRFPRTGRPRSDIQPGLRGISVWPFVVLYEVRERTVRIARVVHGMRDIAAVVRLPQND